MSKEPPVIELIELKNYLGDRWVHNGLNLSINRKEIISIIGPSGCGKTTLLRSILMLRRQTAGTIRVFGVDTVNCTFTEALQLRRRWGVMFQSGALFSSLTVLENVMFPLQEFTSLSFSMRKELAMLKIILAGLEAEAASKYPAELSGGMSKRAALARSIALDAELLFLDEPTAGLDPKSAGELDELVLHLRKTLGLTVVIVTHDLDTLWRVSDRVVFMGEGKILAAEPMEQLMHNNHPLIQQYFSTPRARIPRNQKVHGVADGI
jgi:phospholipid/cholesterol/gamma-HCH transport system ATP-binding protein